MIAQAPLDELLTGGDGLVYSIVLEGKTNFTHDRLVQLPWVKQITSETKKDQTIWQVTVNDETVAKVEMLKLIVSDEHLTVVEFGRHKHELEEVFLNIVEGGQNVK